MIVVVAALKGGVGKTTSAVYLAAVAGGRRPVTIVDADPQASAAEWLEVAEDAELAGATLIEAPTERLLTRALERSDPDGVTVVDTPPGQDRLLARAMELASVVVIPTRVGGVETPRAAAVLDLLPKKVPAGLVITSARTFTRDYQGAVADWSDAGVHVWGSVPERVSIAAGPSGWLSPEGLEAYRAVWRKAQRAAR